MPGCGLDLSCRAGQALDDKFTSFVRSIAEGAARMVAESLTWWTQADQSSLLTTPAIGDVRSLIMPVAIIVLALSVAWQGIQTVIQRRPGPLINVGVGLWGYLAWTTLSGVVAVTLYQGFVELSHRILGPSIGGFGKSVGDTLLALIHQSKGEENGSGLVAIVLFLAVVFLIIAGLQWLAGIARLVGVAVLLALTPLAAAGQINQSTKPWMLKVASWGLALLAYQPVAAAIYATSFEMIAHNQDLTSLLGAMFLMVLAVTALPVLMKLFDWGGQRFTTAGGGGGGMGALAGTGMAGAGMAQYMSSSGPASGGSSEGGGGSSPGGASVAPAHTGASSTGGGGGSSAAEQSGSASESAGQASQASQAGSSASSAGSSTVGGASGSSAAGASSGAAAAGPVGAGVMLADKGRETAQQARDAAANEVTQQPDGPDGAADPSQSSTDQGGQ